MDKRDYSPKPTSKINSSTLRWLNKQGATFVHVRKGSKIPYGKDWQNRPCSLALAEKYLSMGDNVGILLGNHSNNIGMLDLDEDYEAFRKTFPELDDSPTLIRGDTDRAKILIQIDGDIPPSQKFGKNGSRKAEWLSDGNQGVVAGEVDGIPYELINAEQPMPVMTAEQLSNIRGKWTGEGLEERGDKKPAGPIPEKIYEGERNNLLTSIAGTMRRRGMSGEAILSALLKENELRCSPPLPNDDVISIAEGIDRYPFDKYPLSDQGNAQRFADDHKDIVRYDHTNKRWLIWDGARWAPDKDGAIYRKAIETVNKMHSGISQIKDMEKRQAFAKWAHHCEFKYTQESMVVMAKNLKPLAITSDELDVNHWLLNVLNGTIDLRTGKLLPHNPLDMITKIAPVVYDRRAKSEQWEKALNDWTGGDREYLRFLQRAFGYSLTGDVSEKVFFFIYGPHDSGKTTILEAFSATLGDYAHTAPFEMFLRKGGNYVTDGPKPEVIDLMGMRFIKSVEVLEGSRFNEGFLKQITGGDSIRERTLYERGMTFKPVLKLWLAANDAPRARFDDDALWRRLLVVPFTYTIPRKDQDPQLKETLSNPSENGAAILAWGVRGCLDWQKVGLNVPEKITKSTASLRTEMDELADFFDEKVVNGEAETCIFSQVYGAYKQWAYTNGIKMPLTSNKFSREMKKRGYAVKNRTVKGKTEKHIFGIRLDSEKVHIRMSTTREIPKEQR